MAATESTPDDRSKPLVAALQLAEEYGLPVFPCRETDHRSNARGEPVGRKAPYTGGGFHDASRDPEQIVEWWRRWPGALIGVPTGAASGLFVIDIDPRGHDWYAQHSRDLAAGRIHPTERGWHLLYRHCGLRSTSSTVADGVDTRGEGGYVIWWPGCGGATARGGMEDIGDLPAWLQERLRGPRTSVKTDTGAHHADRSRDLLARVASEVRAGRPDPQILQAYRDHPHAREQADPDRTVRRCIEKARGDQTTPTEDTPVLSDDELAERFTERYTDELRYCAELSRWYRWTGDHWAHDNTLAAFDAARASCRHDLAAALVPGLPEAKRRALQTRLGGAGTVAAVLKLAATDRRHAVTTQQLDAEPWLLNTPDGVLDLRSGKLRPHEPGLHLTKITAAAPTADCPTFLRVLARALPDPEVRQYLQRLVGYLLTGVVQEHIVVLAYGAGGNGKSVIFNAIRHALGNYAVTLASEVLMESHNDRHPTEIAVLRGARMALCSEVDSGRRWNESRVKRLSGGDPITARLIARDPFEFLPTHKLILLANAKPGLRTVDEAIRRRIHLVEFNVTIPSDERDPDMPEKLKAEAGGILGWALVGCLDWQTGGLQPPKVVLDATDAYLDREDTIMQWMRECCRPVGQASLSTLHASYRNWAQENGVPVIGRNNFGDQLEARGIMRRQVRPRVWEFIGITPRPSCDDREVQQPSAPFAPFP